MSRHPKLLFLAVLTLVALGARLAVMGLVGGRGMPGVTYEHGEIAENLLAGRGFSVTFLGTSGPTSQQAPFYPALLAAVYKVFDVESPQSLLAVQILQAVAGTMLVLCVVWLSWSLFPDWPTLGSTAGWMAALYPSHVYMVTHFQVAVWAALVLTALLAWVSWQGGRHTWSKAAATGLLAGCLLLIDPILSIALPLVGYLFWRRDRDIVVANGWLTGIWAASGRLGRLGVIAVVATLVIAPWLYRNYCVHGEFVFIKSTFGYAFWQGNNPASWGTDKIPKRSDELLRQSHDGTLADQHRAMWDARHETLYIDDVLLKPRGYREFAGLTEPQRSRLLASRAWDFVQREPVHYLGLCLRRLRYFLLFDETNPKARNHVYRIATVTWLVSASIGLLVLGSRWQTLSPVVAVFATVTLFHTLTITSARFRVPIEPLSFVWAAAPYALLFGRARSALRTWFEARRATTAAGEVDRKHALQGPHTRKTVGAAHRQNRYFTRRR